MKTEKERAEQINETINKIFSDYKSGVITHKKAHKKIIKIMNDNTDMLFPNNWYYKDLPNEPKVWVVPKQKGEQ